MTLITDTDPLRWLHISDFHIKPKSSYDRDRVLGALCKSIKHVEERFGRLDFIIASGDIAFSGKADEYAEATRFLDRLLNAASLDKSRLFVVPGNHDVDRTQSIGLCRTLSTPQEADIYFDPCRQLSHIVLRQNAFAHWFDEYFRGLRSFPTSSTCSPPEIVKIREVAVSISLVNTACFSADEHDQGKLLIGRRCLEEALVASSPDDAELKLAVLHHPLSWLSPVESANIRSDLHDAFDLILSGHLHETDIEQVLGVTGDAIHLTAGAAYQGSEWPNTAMACSYLNGEVTVLPLQFVDRPRDIWTVDPAVFPNSPEFTRTFSIRRPKAMEGTSVKAPLADNSDAISAIRRKEWEDQLFTTPSNRLIYAEPRLMRRPQEIVDDVVKPGEDISVSELIVGPKSYLIETRAEYGGSNLCLRLVYEIGLAGNMPILRDARTLPNYKKKLIPELTQEISKPAKERILILDNLDLDKDERLIREIAETELVDRVIAVSTNRDLVASNIIDLSSLPFGLERIYLWQLSRDGTRKMACEVFDTADPVLVTAVVDKVYNDLLSLCIPLSPSNVIMYLRVLHREGDFSPLNRVHIIERYLAEGLSRPSDMYRGNFNFRNKIDVVSAFVYAAYSRGASVFTAHDWFAFCQSHKAETLKEFSSTELLSELEQGRVIYRNGDQIYLRYKFFFDFFLGRYLTSNREALDKFLEQGEFLQVPGVIDVVTGLMTSNSGILTCLIDRLNQHLKDFGVTYVKPEFDPLLSAIWPDAADEEEKLWKPVHEAIESGPRSVQEIDNLKTCLLSEARTEDQQVVLNKFTDLEHSLFNVATLLSDGLRNSDDVAGSVKLAALDAILRSELAAFQVGTMFADRLATRSAFRWGGVLFTNFDKAYGAADPNSAEAIVAVILTLSHSVANKISEQIGTFKLAAVFRSKAASVTSTGFVEVLLFACILEAKGNEWHETLAMLIRKTEKNAYYLHLMLNILMWHLSYGIMQSKDVDAMKRLVALIHAKRGHNKMDPGAKLVTRMLDTLESQNTFDSAIDKGAKNG